MSVNPNEPERASGDTDVNRTVVSPTINSGKGALVAMYCLALLLVGGTAFSLYWFLSGYNDKFDAEMLSYMSANSNVIVGADLDALSKNSRLKELFRNFDKNYDPVEKLNEKLKYTGLTTDDFSRLLMGVVSDDIHEEQFAQVWRTKKPFDKAKMAEVFGHEVVQQKKGETTYFANRSGNIVYFPTDTLIVLTSGKHFETLTSKKPGKILVSVEMQEFVKKMSKGQAWVVASRAAFTDEDLSILNVIKGFPYFPEALMSAAKDAKMAGLSAKFDKENLTLSGSLVCRDKEQASKAETALEKEIDDRRTKDLADDELIGATLKILPTEVRNFGNDLKKTLKAERSGSQLTLSGELRINDAFTVVKMLSDYQRKLAEREIERAMQEMMHAQEEQLKIQKQIREKEEQIRIQMSEIQQKLKDTGPKPVEKGQPEKIDPK